VKIIERFVKMSVWELRGLGERQVMTLNFLNNVGCERHQDRGRVDIGRQHRRASRALASVLDRRRFTARGDYDGIERVGRSAGDYFELFVRGFGIALKSTIHCNR
jgi:hypothetical protein